MFLGIKLEGWLTILAIIAGPLLAFAVQNWRDGRRERRNRKLDICRKLILTLKVPMNPNHVDALNSIPLEFHSDKKVLDAWRLYVSHLNHRSVPGEDLTSWGEKKFDLLVDLVYEIGQALEYEHLDKALLRDNTYVPKGYGDVEEEWRQIRAAWLQVLNGQRPLVMTVLGTVQVEEPLERGSGNNCCHAATGRATRTSAGSTRPTGRESVILIKCEACGPFCSSGKQGRRMVAQNASAASCRPRGRKRVP